MDQPSTSGEVRRQTRGRRRAGGVVAITGPGGSLASRLVRRLEDDDRYRKLVLIGDTAPKTSVRRAVFHAFDLAAPLADERIAGILRREEVEVVAHLALAEVPDLRSGRSHEVDTFGTVNLLNAAADCATRRTALSAMVVPSTAMVYGASASNPAYLSESAPLRGGSEPGFVRDKVDVERQIEDFRSQFRIRVAVLRPCWTLAAGVSSIAARLLRHPPCLAVLGFDPLLQLLHVDDLVDALKQGVDRRRDGCFNLAAAGPLPLSAVFRLAGRTSWPIPGPLAGPVSDLLWRSCGVGMGVSPDYLRHLWLVDAERARGELGFAPRLATRDVIQAFARAA